jgi:hypothetical protein
MVKVVTLDFNSDKRATELLRFNFVILIKQLKCFAQSYSSRIQRGDEINVNISSESRVLYMTL